MDNVLTFSTISKQRTKTIKARGLTPDETGLLLSLVRATASILGVPRDAYYCTVTSRVGVDDLRDMPRSQLEDLVLYMHSMQLARLTAGRSQSGY